MVILIFSIPIGVNISYLVSNGTTYHLLMRYSWALFYVALIVLIERKNRLKNHTYFILIFVSMICIIFNNIIVSNIAYFNLYYKFEKSYALALKISERIKEFEGYNVNVPVYISGTLDKSKYPLTNKTSRITNEITGTDGDYILFSTEHYVYFFEYYFGIPIKIPTKEQITDIELTNEF